MRLEPESGCALDSCTRLARMAIRTCGILCVANVVACGRLGFERELVAGVAQEVAPQRVNAMAWTSCTPSAPSTQAAT